MALFGPSLPLAGAVALGVWMGAGYTLRLSSKLASALLGFLPALVYLLVATAVTDLAGGAGGTEGLVAGASAVGSAATLAAEGTAVRALPPALRAATYVPVVAAAVAGTVASAVVVAVGWADRWHVRWPGSALAVLAAGPVLALVGVVGVDEVRYGLVLEPGPSADSGASVGDEEARLRAFLHRHPDSPRADEVMARLAWRLSRTQPPGPSAVLPAEALGIWAELFKRWPRSPYAADAALHLGDAAAASGLFEVAERHWRHVLERAEAVAAEAPAEDPLAAFNVVADYFSVGRRLRARRHAERLAHVQEAALLRLAVLAENRSDQPSGRRALALYFRAMALRGTTPYRQALLLARKADPDGPLADNIAYDLALFETGAVKQVEALAKVAETWPKGDGALLAHATAARLLLARAETDPGALRPALAHLQQARALLAERRGRNPEDPYVQAFADRIEKELVYVRAQLRAPVAER